MKRLSALTNTLSFARALLLRDLKGYYRRSLLGPTWAILQPAIYLVIFLWLRTLLNVPDDGVPYALFAYAGLVPWTFLSTSITRSGSCISSNAGIVKKVAVNHAVFPLIANLSAFIDMLFSSLLMIGLMFWFGVVPGLTVLWLFPLLALLILFALGLSLCVAAIGTIRRDIMMALPFLLQLWMLGSPLLYPVSQVPPNWTLLYSLNPLVGILEGFRACLLHNEMPDLSLLGISVLGTIFVWSFSLPLFKTTSRYFADIL